MEPLSDGNGARFSAGLCGREVLGTGLKRILRLLLSNSALSSASPPCTAGGTSGCRRGQAGPSGEGIGASAHPRSAGAAREGCHQPLCAAPLLSPPKGFPAVFSCLQQDEPSR